MVACLEAGGPILDDGPQLAYDEFLPHPYEVGEYLEIQYLFPGSEQPYLYEIPFTLDGWTTTSSYFTTVIRPAMDAWENRETLGGRLQLAIQFSTWGNTDNQEDRVYFDAQDLPGTVLLPFVEIEYRR